MIYPKNYEQKIGFDHIRQLLKSNCLSTLGTQRVNEMSFSNQFDNINSKLDQTAEFVRIIQEESDFPSQYFIDIRSSLKRIRLERMYLDEQELFDLKRSLETIRDIIRFLTKKEDENDKTDLVSYPALYKLTNDIQVFPKLIDKINSLLDKFGKIRDNASPTLSNIRRELAKTTGSISHTLNNILRMPNWMAMLIKMLLRPFATAGWLFL